MSDILMQNIKGQAPSGKDVINHAWWIVIIICLHLYQYIEMNPIKAGMVEGIADYQWSSYHHNALGQTDSLISEHSMYKALGTSNEQRCEAYLKMFARLNTTKQEKQITNATLRGEVLGDDGFHRKIKEVALKAD